MIEISKYSVSWLRIFLSLQWLKAIDENYFQNAWAALEQIKSKLMNQRRSDTDLIGPESETIVMNGNLFYIRAHT